VGLQMLDSDVVRSLAKVVPCGFSEACLPIGFQVVGKPLQETTMLQIGQAYEAATRWHTRKPDLTGSRSAITGR